MKKAAVAIVSLLAFVLPLAASAAPQNTDVGVTIVGPGPVMNYSAGTYTTTVKNYGPGAASNIVLSIDFPDTNTSPTVSVLGTISGMDSRCSMNQTVMRCNLGTLNKNKTTTVSFGYSAPIAAKSLALQLSVATAQNDINTQNNTTAITPNVTYPQRSIVAGTIVNSHCTGTNLSAYFECALYPSSISSHTVTFNSDQTITLPEPGYTGMWSQPTLRELHFEYHDTTGKIMEFNGYAHGTLNCFDGITTFFPSNGYNSAYRVCM